MSQTHEASEKASSKESLDLYQIEVQVLPRDTESHDENNYSDADYARVLRKVDRILLPLMWICYGIQQADKTSLANQAIFGIRSDTQLKGQQYQWLTTIFYITFLVGELPSNFLLQRFPMGRMLTIYMFCFGGCVLLVSIAQNFTHLLVLRALQGFFQCTISPGFVLLTATFYTVSEHSSRALFWQSANAGFGILFDLCSYGIALYAQKHPGGLAPWRGISVFLGSITILCAIVCFFLLGTPKEVRWLSREEKNMVNARVVKNKAGRDTTGIKWNWQQVNEALTDPQCYFYVCNAFLACVPNGGLSTFGNILSTSFGFTELQVLLVGIPRSIASLLLFLAVGIYTARVRNRRLWIMAAALVPPFAGFLALSLLPNEPRYKWVKWGLYFMNVPFVLTLFMGWTLITSNVAGRTKKTIISSATFLGYCLGNIVGSQIFKTADAPHYIPGIITCSICFGLNFLLVLAWRSYYVKENARRDAVLTRSGLSVDTQEETGRRLGEMDVTDSENLYFRYTL
ncbi:putative major facilitator superfamily transporter protein [Favolaschia claudopus]|uniref:Major facilitator superfamily transporter protein n=1 Tax=Favolaschia claudopus TaxID=2862362 RepID=A0AAV9Z972_9AGAR